MQEQFAGPIEDIGFAWILVGRRFEFVGGNNEVAFLLFRLAKKVVQFGGVLVL